MSDSDQEAYAAANLRERMRDVDLSESKEAYPHAGLVSDDSRRNVLNHLALVADDDVQEYQAYQDLVQPSGTETLTRAVGDGNVSQMQYAVGLVDHTEDGQDALSRVARELAREGCVGLIVGPPGAGKTATALDVVRIWKALTGGTVISNVDWEGTDKTIHSNREMLDAMQSVSGQVLALVDEAAQVLTSRGSDQELTNHFAKELKLIRKQEEGDEHAKRGSFLGIGHTRRDTAADIRRLTSIVLEKPSRRDPGRATLYESPGGQDSLEQVGDFEGITDTSESYNEHDPAPFRVHLDDSDDSEDSEETNYQRQVETALRAVLIQGQSYTNAADLVEYGNSWVGERVREWRRGEWRDIVPEDAVPADAITA
ncbi:AAA family ATPase [Halovenus marina]|uniref:AAA family ATPase n=1 Tax=Halovenus marina TaxID=3396621 RepID=UPI003F55B793